MPDELPKINLKCLPETDKKSHFLYIVYFLTEIKPNPEHNP